MNNLNDEYTTDFFENNDHALRSSKIILRDSIGSLAIQILASRKDISKMKNNEILSELHEIIYDLQSEYSRKHTSFD